MWKFTRSKRPTWNTLGRIGSDTNRDGRLYASQLKDINHIFVHCDITGAIFSTTSNCTNLVMEIFSMEWIKHKNLYKTSSPILFEKRF